MANGHIFYRKVFFSFDGMVALRKKGDGVWRNVIGMLAWQGHYDMQHQCMHTVQTSYHHKYFFLL
mgnify:CR=1 FL=1